MNMMKGKAKRRDSNALLEVDAGVCESDWDREQSGSTSKLNEPVTFMGIYKPTLIWIAVCLLIAFTCAIIPSAFLMANTTDCSTVKSQNSKLDKTNNMLLEQSVNYSTTVNKLADQLAGLEETVKLMEDKLKVQKDSLTNYFKITFTTLGNRSVEYALVTMPDRITWNQADLFCKSIQSELAYPDASIPTSVDDLKQACEASNSSCCSCWVGLTKQYEPGVWQTSAGGDANTDEKMWASGQEFVKKHPDYDCAYIFNGLLYSMYCTGNSSQNHSLTVVADRFVCQSPVDL